MGINNLTSEKEALAPFLRPLLIIYYYQVWMSYPQILQYTSENRASEAEVVRLRNSQGVFLSYY